jgi:D-alanine-D-alanine ligase
LIILFFDDKIKFVNLKAKKICVLMGGRSGEREISLRSGKKILESLQRQGYNVISSDLEDDLIAKLKAEKVDLVFIALHGKFGEDGTVQGLLEIAGIPYTGSKVLASALAMNKIASKQIFNAVGIPTPRYLKLTPEITEEKIAAQFPFPLVLKPISEGSSLGVSILKNAAELKSALAESLPKYKEMFIEEYILGKEITIGIIGTGTKTEALPILELVPKNEFYDYHAKYSAGQTDFIIPARLPKPLYQKAQAIALDAHRALGCYGLSRVDMIVGRDHLPYVTEVNSIPGMTDLSDLPAEAAYAGLSYDELVVRILASAY